jgi:hypothetical protein
MCADPGTLFTAPMIGDLFNTGTIFRGPVQIRGNKISENESPMPMDRVFATFNYWDNVSPAVFHELGLGRAEFYREIFGIEKTFFDANASVGVRLPLITDHLDSGSEPGGKGTVFGDMDIILKYVLLKDPASGSVLTGGLLVTAPTGPDNPLGFTLPNPPGVSAVTAGPHSTLLQPFLGYIWRRGDWYVHGFSSISVPTDSRESTTMFNDVGTGYFFYQNEDCNRLVTAIVPTIEVHVNTPLDQAPFRFRNSVDLTQGLTLEMSRRAWFTVGVCENVSGPKIFDIEAVAQLNLRF